MSLRGNHLRCAVVTMHDFLALADLHGKLDNRVVARLAMDFGQQIVRLLLGEEAATRDRRQLAGVAEHQHLGTE
jgi:hypothetical protein